MLVNYKLFLIIILKCGVPQCNMNNDYKEDIIIFIITGLLFLASLTGLGVGFWFVYKIYKGIFTLLVMLIDKI